VSVDSPGDLTSPLRGLRVVQGEGAIEVAYCAKILADAGADVVVIEGADGHPLRRRGGSDAMFHCLHAGKRNVVGPLDDVVGDADVLITDALGQGGWDALHARHPALTVVAVTPFGLEGPWAARPASDLTLQALSGGMAPRGDAGRAPLMVGGEPTAWFAGAVGAVALLGVLDRVAASGVGELLDVSQLESAHLEHSMYPVTYASMAGVPFHRERGMPVPGIEPTADGQVGFFVITGQQWLDFCALIEQPHWLDDPSLFIAVERRRRAAELEGPIRAWTTQRTTDEIVEIASLMRIPVAPIGNGSTIPEIDHFVEERWLLPNPAGFVQPRPPHRFVDAPITAIRPAPSLPAGEQPGWAPRPDQAVGGGDGDAGDRTLPLRGMRIADFTAFWAGPLAAQILAGLGAEVIHIEGPKRPDGIRMNTLKRLDEDQWWEWSPLFCGANTNKRALAVDLATPAGHQIAMRLLATCDLMIENFSPRVVEQLGLAPEIVQAVNPALTVVRMPAFGLAGPWRDRVGFAQTIEQASGLAFLTGYEGESPVIPNGMCDPIAGVHAAIAALLGLRQRRASGRGHVIEAPMIGGALNTAAEQIVEHSANGTLMRSAGNRSPWVEQAVWRCAGDDEWVAVTLPSAAHQSQLLARVGVADLDQFAQWCREHTAADIEQLGVDLAIPISRVTWAHEIVANPQLVARRYFEQVTHPLIGAHPYVSFPVRFSGGPHQWNRTPAPMLGADNVSLLLELGYDEATVAELAAQAVIADSVITNQQGW
jgi:crotonobetainyl-CoA:carnitine CoA-transferase CaiB-like acyl-CoA transferase